MRQKIHKNGRYNTLNLSFIYSFDRSLFESLLRNTATIWSSPLEFPFFLMTTIPCQEDKMKFIRFTGILEKPPEREISRENHVLKVRVRSKQKNLSGLNEHSSQIHWSKVLYLSIIINIENKGKLPPVANGRTIGQTRDTFWKKAFFMPFDKTGWKVAQAKIQIKSETMNSNHSFKKAPDKKTAIANSGSKSNSPPLLRMLQIFLNNSSDCFRDLKIFVKLWSSRDGTVPPPRAYVRF